VLWKCFLHNSYITELCCEDPPSSLFPFSFIKDVFVYSFFSDTSSCKACNTPYLQGYLYTPSELRNLPYITDSPTKPYIKQGKTASSFYFKSFHLIPFLPLSFSSLYTLETFIIPWLLFKNFSSHFSCLRHVLLCFSVPSHLSISALWKFLVT